jgi:hypothetical protein
MRPPMVWSITLAPLPGMDWSSFCSTKPLEVVFSIRDTSIWISCEAASRVKIKDLPQYTLKVIGWMTTQTLNKT